MIARLLIASSTDRLQEEITKSLSLYLEGLPAGKARNVNHPDLLLIRAGEKLGIAEAKKIKEFFSFKPYSAQGRVVVLENASTLTHEAQSALLKTIEELPDKATFILGASSDANLLPTILSRCKIINLEAQSNDKPEYYSKYIKDLEKLLSASIEEGFVYIEKQKDKEEFLRFLIYAFREAFLHSKSSISDTIVQLLDKKEAVKYFLDELLQVEEWAKQNVNMRAILEYLMLVMPRRK